MNVWAYACVCMHRYALRVMGKGAIRKVVVSIRTIWLIGTMMPMHYDTDKLQKNSFGCNTSIYFFFFSMSYVCCYWYDEQNDRLRLG